MQEVIKKYEALSGRKINQSRIEIYAKINELSDMAELIDQPELKTYKKAKANIERWINNKKIT